MHKARFNMVRFYTRWQALMQEGQILTLVDWVLHKEAEFLCLLASSYTTSESFTQGGRVLMLVGKFVHYLWLHEDIMHSRR